MVEIQVNIKCVLYFGSVTIISRFASHELGFGIGCSICPTAGEEGVVVVVGGGIEGV